MDIKEQINQAMDGLVKNDIQTEQGKEIKTDEIKNQNNETTNEATTNETASNEQEADNSPKNQDNTEENQSGKKNYPKYVPYDRFKQVIQQRNSLQEELGKLKDMKSKLDIDPEDEEVLKQLEEYGFVRKEDLEKEIKERELKQIEEQQVKEYENYLNKLEEEFNSKDDGFPKFDKEEVIKFGMENNIYDPQAAFYVMHLGEIIDYYVKQELKKVKTQPDFGKKTQEEPQPKNDRVSFRDGTIKEKIREFLMLKNK